ncbi:MAG: hypothetical protein WB581_06255 [Halobacteriota archaeon]
MTLVLTIKVKEGLVLAADSRMNFPGGRRPSDSSMKLFTFKNHKHVAVLVSGAAIIVEDDNCAPNELFAQLEKELPSERLSISVYAEQLHKCFEACYKNEWEGSKRPEMENRLTSNPQTTFHVAGFDEDARDGWVFKLVLHLRAERSNNPPKSELKILPVDGGELLKGSTCGIACGGNCKIFERVYEEYFFGNKDLIQKPRNPDGTFRIPDKTSLQEAKTLICSLMGRAIYSQRDLKSAEIGGEICACTITQDDGLKMFDCDDFQ